MEQILKKISVQRAIAALESAGMKSQIHILSESAHSAKEAAEALGLKLVKLLPKLFFVCQMRNRFSLSRAENIALISTS